VERSSKKTALMVLQTDEDVVDYCQNPQLLFDQKVYKYFDVDGHDQWFWGRVDGFDAKSGYYKISYSDGDFEDMTLKEVLEWKLCADRQEGGGL
jgi:hypothetical protein